MRPARAGALAFLTAFVTLFVQVLVHRVISAKLLNNYAFLVISLTMLGFALSGVILSRWLGRFLERLEAALNLSAAAFVVTLLGATAVFYRAPAWQQYTLGRADFLSNMARGLLVALLYAVPFVFCGLILGALLSSPRLAARRIYFFDLVGSSLGALCVIPAITWLGVEASLLAAAAVMAVGTAALVPPRGPTARAAMAAALAVLALATVSRGRIFEMRFPEGSILAPTSDPRSGMVLEHTVWDPLARIEMARIPPPRPEKSLFPALMGTNAGFLARFHRVLTQNNYAFTYATHYDGDPRSLRGIEETIYAAAYEAGTVRAPRVMVIGVGGGFDVLAALRFEASHVDAVEVNRATVDILRRTYRDYFRHWVDDPRVNLVHAEGRHYLATRGGEYDVIQLSGVDSYSGTPAAAHVFSENFLYTAEAFDLYLSKLSPDGVLNMMRLEFSPPREMLRAVVTAVEALRRRGVPRPADHIVTLTSREKNFTALLVKRTPFLREEVERLERWAGRGGLFDVSAAPDRNPRRETLYALFLDLGDPRGEAAFHRAYHFDVSPSTDNRPFFFRYSSWSHLWSREPVVLMSTPVMEYSVLLLLVIVGLASIACVALPLRALAGGGLRVPHAGRWALYFAGAGIGYMAVEIAFLQKFGHFLGHPNYALSVVLAALLMASGVGSLFSARITSALGQVRFVAYVLALVVLVEYGLILPRLPAWISLPFALRCAIVGGLVAPAGVCLGVFVPTALERLKDDAAAFAPWAWGINGIFSVMAPVAAVALSISWGINALLLSAIPVYLAVGWAFPAEASGTREKIEEDAPATPSP
jgi:spermidine synthase